MNPSESSLSICVNKRSPIYMASVKEKKIEKNKEVMSPKETSTYHALPK